MFGNESLISKFIFASIVFLFCLFGYTYIKDLHTTVANQAAVIASQKQSISRLENANKNLAEDRKVEKDICGIRSDTVAEDSNKASEINKKKNKILEDMDNAISKVSPKVIVGSSASSVTNSETKVRILNIEYDALEASQKSLTESTKPKE